MALVSRKIQLHILIGQFNGRCRRINRVHRFGTSLHGIKRKTSGVTKHVQHIAAFRKFLHQLAVFALIDKEPRFLSILPVHLKTKAMFQHFVCARSIGAAKQITVFRFYLGFKRQCFFAFIVNGFQMVAHHFLQSFHQLFAYKVHSNGVRLHYRCTVVKINNQARHSVAFSVNQTKNICFRVIFKPHLFTQVPRTFYFAFPEIVIRFHLFKRHNTNGNRSDLVVAHCQKPILVRIYFYHVALGRFTVHFFYGSGEYPRVKTQQ